MSVLESYETFTIPLQSAIRDCNTARAQGVTRLPLNLSLAVPLDTFPSERRLRVDNAS